jgi:hypothetical protein
MRVQRRRPRLLRPELLTSERAAASCSKCERWSLAAELGFVNMTTACASEVAAHIGRLPYFEGVLSV